MDTPKLSVAELLFNRARKMGLKPSWISPGGLFAVDTDQGQRYVNFSVSMLNSEMSSCLAKNKYLTRLILEQHGLPNIPYTRPKTIQDAEAFLEKYQKIIVKPIRGAGSRDIHIVEDVGQLAGMDIRRYILEQYIPGREMRYLVLNNEVIGVHRSEYGTSVEESRALQRISYPRGQWDVELIGQSLKVAGIVGLNFAAIDYLIDSAGNTYILEVNTAPGLKWFHAPTQGPAIDVARMLLEATFGTPR